MAETKYISYGLNLLPLDKVMTALADRVDSYLDSQPFSNKVKNRWKELYMDVINNKGLLGASNQNGIWEISHGGDSTDNVSQRDKAIYGDIAYYILLTMSNIDSSTKKEEELKKAELEKFGSFDDNFKNYITKYKYRGRDWSNDWVNLDTRDASTGLLNTTNRINELKKYLLQYKESLKDYDYEGSSFDNADDLKNSIDAAIQGLNNGDVNAISLVGLDPKEWLYNGAEDIAGTDAEGNKYTYSQLAQLNLLKAQQQAEAEQVKKQEIILNNRGIDLRVGGIHAVEARNSPEAYANWLAQTYGVGQQGFNGINNRVQELIDRAYSSSLTNSDKKELGNLLFYIRKYNPNYNDGLNLSDEEWAELNKHSLTDKNRNNYIHLPWKTNGKDVYADGQGNLHILKNQNNAKLPTAFKKSLAAINYRNNFLLNTNKGNTIKRNNYLASKKNGLTSAEWEELASIGFDIASIVDPEMISSAGLALAGSGLRHHAAASQPGGMSTSDKWWQAADYGLSILGSIPVLGDAALAARAVNNLKKAIVPLGIVMAGANVPQAAKAAYNKVVNGLDLTIQDWRAIGAVLTAAVGVGRGRLMSKRAEALRRTGGNTSKTIKEGMIKTSEGEIKVDEATAKQLETQFKGADGATRTLKLRENAKVKEAARLQGIDLSKAEVQGHGRFKRSPISFTPSTVTTSGNRLATLRAMSKFNKNHGWLARKGLAEQDFIFRHTGGYESTSNSNWFKDIWNNLRKSEWDEFGNKNNPTTTNTSPQLQNQGINVPSGRFDDRSMAREVQLNSAVINRYKNVLSGKFSKNAVKEGKYKLNDINVEVKKAPTGTYDIFINGKRTDSIKDLTSTELKKNIASLVKDHRSSINRGKPKSEKVSTKEIGKILQDLKRKGWLKQGGQINNNIDNIISEFLASKLI